MKTRRSMDALIGFVVWSLFLIGCGGRTEGYATDTKTNWLARCSDTDDCDDGLECLCGVCTLSCEEQDACEPFGKDAACRHAECAPSGGVCALPRTPLPSERPEEPECPRAKELYLPTEPDSCTRAAIDCSPGFQKFVDECGCGCEPDPACDPEVEYAAYGRRCELIDFECGVYAEPVYDDCGCGCRETTAPDLECAEAPFTYLGTVEQCKTVDFDVDCLAGSWFEDECGCGCIPQSNCDDTIDYVAFGRQCELTDFECAEDHEYASDACGCGCRLAATTECAHDESEYVGLGDACKLLDFVCDAGDKYFSDECGCGCERKPECDPAISYVVAGGCDVVDYECGAGEVYAGDECGCGCAPNPACDPAVEYRTYGGCAGALFGCAEGEQMVMDACGCGCFALAALGDDDTCPTPSGELLDTELLEQVTCTTDTLTDRIVVSQAELDAVLRQCAPDAAPQLTYAGAPLYLQTVATDVEVRHLYTVATGTELRVGVQYPLECGTQTPPQSVLVLQIAGLQQDTIVQEYVCNSAECPE